MLRISSWQRLGSVVVVAASACLLAGPWSGAQAATIRHASKAGCDALGTYHVGPTIPPPVINPPQTSGQGASTPGVAIAYPIMGGTLAGTITLTAYTGCGSPTVGSFTVALSRYRGPLPMTTNSGTGKGQVTEQGTATYVAQPIIGGTTVLTATGTFKQDPAHPTDPSYLSVDASVTYGRYILSCPPLCGAQKAPGTMMCVPMGCHTGETISRVADFTAVTGYLSLQTGKPATLALSFLPPPDPKAITANATLASLQPITLLGTRTGS